MDTLREIAQRLALKNVGTQSFIIELTWLLFLKIASERGNEEHIPKEYRWSQLIQKDGIELYELYRDALLALSRSTHHQTARIFATAGTQITEPVILHTLLQEVDKLDWYDEDIRRRWSHYYEQTFASTFTEHDAKAGTYLTPRPLIQSIVHLMKPCAGEIIQDPAFGTGGFLILAAQAIRQQTDDYYSLSEAQQYFQRNRAYNGVDIDDSRYRLAHMNLLLSDVEGTLLTGDTLSKSIADKLGEAHLILCNPPFGSGGAPTRDDFTFLTSNKQLNFVQHIYRALKPGGRAAIVLPDSVLSAPEKTSHQIRCDMMDKCRLHTILRLPTGIFHAHGVNANVLFIERGRTDAQNTDAVWVYDMRANMPSFGKRTPLTREHFADFERCYGDDPNGRSPRHDQGESGRWRCFSRAYITKRSDKLNIAWLKDSNRDHPLDSPVNLADSLVDLLTKATQEISELRSMLDD